VYDEHGVQQTYGGRSVKYVSPDGWCKYLYIDIHVYVELVLLIATGSGWNGNNFVEHIRLKYRYLPWRFSAGHERDICAECLQHTSDSSKNGYGYLAHNMVIEKKLMILIHPLVLKKLANL
jgi:hypothetical protein